MGGVRLLKHAAGTAFGVDLNDRSAIGPKYWYVIGGHEPWCTCFGIPNPRNHIHDSRIGSDPTCSRSVSQNQAQTGQELAVSPCRNCHRLVRRHQDSSSLYRFRWHRSCPKRRTRCTLAQVHFCPMLSPVCVNVYD